MLSEVLGRVLFGQPCAVEEFTLEQGQVGLQEHDRREDETVKGCSWLVYLLNLLPQL